MIKKRLLIKTVMPLVIVGSISPIMANKNNNTNIIDLNTKNTPIIRTKNDPVLSVNKDSEKEIEVIDNNIMDDKGLGLAIDENQVERKVTENNMDLDIQAEELDSKDRDSNNLFVDKIEVNKIEDNRIKDKNKDIPVKAPMDLSQHLNPYVLEVINTYSLVEGKYPYLLNNDYENYNGVTEDIYYKRDLILKAHPSGKKYSHCTGISFEVFFKAMEKRNEAKGLEKDDFNGMTKEQLIDFMLTWYVAKGPKSESNLAVAIEKYGLGKRITKLEDASAGDFVDISRENNTGHAVIFIDWIREGSKIIGIKHWSSQQSTNGISYKEEYFNIKNSSGKKYGNVILDNIHIARVGPIGEYK